MGLGKTIIMIAAHQLDYNPDDEPEMITNHTAAALKKSQTVLVGRNEETAKEVSMYTGFKQMDDAVRNIIPDNSVRVLLLWGYSRGMCVVLCSFY